MVASGDAVLNLQITHSVRPKCTWWCAPPVGGDRTSLTEAIWNQALTKTQGDGWLATEANIAANALNPDPEDLPRLDTGTSLATMLDRARDVLGRPEGPDSTLGQRSLRDIGTLLSTALPPTPPLIPSALRELSPTRVTIPSMTDLVSTPGMPTRDGPCAPMEDVVKTEELATLLSGPDANVQQREYADSLINYAASLHVPRVELGHALRETDPGMLQIRAMATLPPVCLPVAYPQGDVAVAADYGAPDFTDTSPAFSFGIY